MKSIILAAFIFLSFSFVNAQVSSLEDVMPKPKSAELGTGEFRLTEDLSVSYSGTESPRLKKYVERALRRLERRTVFGFDRSATKNGSQIRINSESNGSLYPKLGEDESYELRIDRNTITLNSKTDLGAMRGIETLLQLLDSDRAGFYFPQLKVVDSPRFEWRGLLIDVARHYQPLHVLKRNIDAMAAVKMNVLHWHLTEDQGFRAESKLFPKLHEMGSDGLYYTQEEMREIVSYAADRGIRVMPEFDMPGHATSWVVGYPEIASAPGPYEIERKPGVFDPTLDPTNEKTYELVGTFLGEMASIFPDEYMHIGGDENNGKQWTENERIQEFMKDNGLKDNHELQTFFNKKIQKILRDNKKIMMGWDEILQPDLPKDVIIHSWRGKKALVNAAKKGFSSVLSNGYYIDLMNPAWKHYENDPLPADSDLTPDQQKLVLGGEATMWSEWVSPETIDSRIWMRTAAIAERLWSPQNVRDVDDMYRRLGILSIQLEDLGLTHRKNQAFMLRRLTNSNETTAMEIFIDLIEPVKGYRRYQELNQTMLDPFTGLVDIAQPDAPAALRFNKFVASYLEKADETSAIQLRDEIERWDLAASLAKPVFDETAALADGRAFPSELAELSEIGLVLLNSIEHDEILSETESKEFAVTIEKAAKPKLACEFAIIDGLKLLLGKASQKNK